MVRKTYLPPGLCDLQCVRWQLRPPSQGIREKLEFIFKIPGTHDDERTVSRYYTAYRTDDDEPFFPPRSDYTAEIGSLWPNEDNIQPNDLVGKVVRCKVKVQETDRRKKKIKNSVRPNVVEEILGWPE